MITTGLDGIIKFIYDNNLNAWTIKRGNGANDYVFKSVKDAPVETNINNMKQVMSYVQGGRFEFQGSTTGSHTGTGMFSETFSHLEGYHQQGQQAQIGSVGIPEGYISKTEASEMMQNALAAFQKEQELIALKQQVKDLEAEKKELQTPINEFMRHLAPLAPPLINGLLGKMGMAGAGIGTIEASEENINELNNNTMNPQDENQDLQNEDMTDKFEVLINEWLEVDPECLTLLEGIVKLAKDNPAKYNMAKSML